MPGTLTPPDLRMARLTGVPFGSQGHVLGRRGTLEPLASPPAAARTATTYNRVRLQPAPPSGRSASRVASGGEASGAMMWLVIRTGIGEEG